MGGGRLLARKAEQEQRGRPAILAGESIPQAAARQATESRAAEESGLQKTRKPREPEAEWWTAIKKDFGVVNRKQMEEDEKDMSASEAKKAFDSRLKQYKEFGSTSTFTIKVPENIAAAALKRGFAPIGEKQIAPVGKEQIAPGISFTP
jgi:hypothetical protein